MKRKPEEMARLKILESDLDHLSRTGNLLLGYQQKCADQTIVASAKRNQEAARQAIAAAAG